VQKRERKLIHRWIGTNQDEKGGVGPSGGGEIVIDDQEVWGKYIRVLSVCGDG